MAYPQQARFVPAADYYEAPRSAPLESPQEYRHNDYGITRQEQNYSYDDDPRNYQDRSASAHQHQRQHQQAYPQQKRNMDRVPQNQHNGGHRNERWEGHDPAPNINQGAPRGFGGGNPSSQNGYNYGSRGGPRDRYYEPQPAYGSRQGHPNPAQHQAGLASRPAPQRSFSDGGNQQHNPHGESSYVGQDQHNRRPSDANRVRPPDLSEAPFKKPGESQRAFSSVQKLMDALGGRGVRILTQPDSPENLAWDNPFPSFPHAQEKKKAAKVEGDRPHTASNRRSQESARSHERRNDGAKPRGQGSRRHEQGNNTYQANTLDSIVARAIHRHADHGPEVVSRGDPSQPPHSQPSHNFGFVQDQQDPHAMAFPLSNQHFGQESQRSNTMPTEISHNTTTLSLPTRERGNGAHPSDSYRQKAPEQYQHQIRAESRQPAHGRSSSFGTSHNYNSHPPPLRQHQPGLDRPPPAARESYGDVVDSYYDASKDASYDINPHYFDKANLEPLPSPGEDDMPNFDAIPNVDGAAAPAIVNKDLHIDPKTISNIPVNSDPYSRGRPNQRAPAPHFAGQAQRSRSQPNSRSAPRNADYRGFDFGNATDVPQMPPFNPRMRQDDSNNRPQQGQQPYRRSPPNYHSQTPPDQRPQNGSYQPPGRPEVQGYGPVRGYGSPEPQSIRDQRMSPGPSMRPPGGPSPMIRPGTAGPSPLNTQRIPSASSGRSMGPGPSPISRKGPSSPPTAKPNNPDALPEHPAPVRPGLMQQSPSPNSGSRPPPVRQYNSPSPAGIPQPSNYQPPPQGPALVTAEELQRLRQIVQANPGDQATQLVLAKKMVEAASVLADEGGHADPKTRNKNRERYILDAHKLVKKLVSAGNVEAMFYLADCHGSGLLGLQKDPKEAFTLYQSAAKLGHPQSAYRVAVCCELGQDEGGGTKRDPLKAMQWYKRAATLGDTPAMYKLGMIQLKGLLGQSKNPREAIGWLKRAAERADEENPHALHELVSPSTKKPTSKFLIPSKGPPLQLRHRQRLLHHPRRSLFPRTLHPSRLPRLQVLAVSPGAGL